MAVMIPLCATILPFPVILRRRIKPEASGETISLKPFKQTTWVPPLKGLSEIVPTFETVFVLACHYAISKLCKGMLHHYGVWHVPPRLHIHRFRPWAPVRLPGVCFLTNAHAQPDSALRALLLACRLELRHARLRVSRTNV